MNILAVETSCDDTAISIVRDGREIIASEALSQIKKHSVFGGVVPEIASRCHLEMICQIFKIVLDKSNFKKSEIDAVAVTYAPGLIGSLLVGLNFAKGLAFSFGVPLIPVHHLKSHIASNYISNENLTPPFMCLVASGGHTHIIEVKDYTNMKVVGKTRDDAAGETFDKAGRRLGMAYPGGVNLDKAAEEGDQDSFKFTIPTLEGSLYDFSFSGLKTAVINKINNLIQKNLDIPVADISASLRKTVVEYLIKNLINAATDLNYKKIVIAGGVSANSLLRKRLKQECENLNLEYFMPNLDLCGDNAAMVGSQGYYEFLNKNIASLSLNAYANVEI